MTSRSSVEGHPKVLIDLGAIKSGGGAQLASNFIDLLQSDVERHAFTFLLLPEKGPLSKRHLPSTIAGVFRSPSNYVKRAIFEIHELQRLIRCHNIHVIYSYFGSGLPHPHDVLSIVTVAYPIICYPDSPYWRYLPITARLYKMCINLARKQRLTFATRVLAETDVMRGRLSDVLGVDKSGIGLLRPAVSDYLKPVDRLWPSGGSNFVILSGADPHKNLWRLYGLAVELARKYLAPFTFTLTVDEATFCGCLRERRIDRSVFNKHFRFRGQVEPDRIGEIYQGGNYVLNISDLESFSNNYLEAWQAGLPLVVSDRDFARHICGNSAFYIEPHRPAEAAAKMVSLMNDERLKQELVRHGKERLAQQPSHRARYDAIWQEIANVVQRNAGAETWAMSPAS
jgi:glycosyltransferase involved in cell wall biosynthesis